eukprot:jgi/Chrzof1/12228/Cz06g26090.t1
MAERLSDDQPPDATSTRHYKYHVHVAHNAADPNALPLPQQPVKYWIDTGAGLVDEQEAKEIYCRTARGLIPPLAEDEGVAGCDPYKSHDEGLILGQ